MSKSAEDIKKDMNLFIEIQVWKYFQLHKIEKFATKEEAKKIIDKITQAYNAQIVPHHERLDNSTPEAKAAWFNSVDVDYKA